MNLTGPGASLEGLREEPELIPCFSPYFKFLSIRESHGWDLLGLPFIKNKGFSHWAEEEQKGSLTLHQS